MTETEELAAFKEAVGKWLPDVPTEPVFLDNFLAQWSKAQISDGIKKMEASDGLRGEIALAQAVLDEIQRLTPALNALIKELEEDRWCGQSLNRAKARRASLDLTRALAAFRNPYK